MPDFFLHATTAVAACFYAKLASAPRLAHKGAFVPSRAGRLYLYPFVPLLHAWTVLPFIPQMPYRRGERKRLTEAFFDNFILFL